MNTNDSQHAARRGMALRYAVAGTLVLFVAALVAFSSRSTATPRASGDGILGVTRTSPGVVEVELTPRTLKDGHLIVDIRVTTHTVWDLDTYDLTKITRLEHDGTRVAPTAAPKLHGHHNAGQLEFPMAKMPSGFTITIDGLHTPGARTFTWP